MLRKIAYAFGTACALFYLVVFIQRGTIWFFNPRAFIELGLIFGFLLPTFWAHGQISAFISSPRLARLSALARSFIEAVAVILTSILFWLVFFSIPQRILIPTVATDPVGMRLMLAVTAVLSLFFYYFVEREKGRRKLEQEFLRAEQLQKESFQAQLEALKSQVNPHFLFNSLNVLGSLIHKDAEQAVAFLHRLAGLYRAVLTHGDAPTVPLRAELELADAYVYLMKTRFGATLEVEINVPAALHRCQVPPAVLQLLVENAIKHNGATARRPLQVRIYAEAGQLVVENNRQPRHEDVASTGIGLQNIRNRYQHLTDQPVQVLPTPETFTVRLPLLPALSA